MLTDWFNLCIDDMNEFKEGVRVRVDGHRFIEIKIKKQHPDGGHYSENYFLEYDEAKKLSDDLADSVVTLKGNILSLLNED